MVGNGRKPSLVTALLDAIEQSLEIRLSLCIIALFAIQYAQHQQRLVSWLSCVRPLVRPLDLKVARDGLIQLSLQQIIGRQLGTYDCKLLLIRLDVQQRFSPVQRIESLTI